MEGNRDPQAVGPRVLDGVRVLDFTTTISGPYCTRLLADLGAEVIKVESPAGEFLRSLAPLRDGASTVFAQLNCGKKSLAMNLKRPEAIEIIKELTQSYDVVVENFSPGVMDRLGLSYAALSRHNPRLIMCSISGFGQTGPAAKRPAYAPAVQAESGWEMVYLQYHPELDRPLNMGPPIADTTASLQALSAINGALFYRERTGKGQHLDISMLDTLISTVPKEFQQVYWPSTPDRIYGSFKTKDGFVFAMAVTQLQFTSLAGYMGKPELLTDPRFAETPERLKNYKAYTAIIADWLCDLTTDEAIAALEAAKAPCARYRSMAEATQEPQLAHRQMIVEIEDPSGPMLAMNSPFLFSETMSSVRPWSAWLGQHNQEILKTALGYTSDRIAQLEADGVVTGQLGE